MISISTPLHQESQSHSIRNGLSGIPGDLTKKIIKMNPFKSQEEETKATAYHEAGHIFMIRLFGYDVINASIDKDNGGETNYSPYTPPELIEDLMEKYIFTCIAFAGSIAEDIFRELDEPFTSLGTGSGLDDFSKYKKLGFPIGSSDRFLDPVRKIVEENWDLISHIADIICEKKCLSCSEVNEIFQDKDLDEKQEFYKLELSKISLP